MIFKKENINQDIHTSNIYETIIVPAFESGNMDLFEYILSLKDDLCNMDSILIFFFMQFQFYNFLSKNSPDSLQIRKYQHGQIFV